MSTFEIEVCFGVDIGFDYFDVDLLLDVLQISTEIRRSKRILTLIKEHGKRHRIVQIAKRQMALDIVKTALDKGLLNYDPYFQDKQVIATTRDRLYDAQERFLQVCLSLSIGKSVRSLRKLNQGFDSRELRVLSAGGRSLFRYFRGLLNDHTRDYIVAFKEGRIEENSAPQVDTKPVPELPGTGQTPVAVGIKNRRSMRAKSKQTEFNVEVISANKLLLEGQTLLTEQVRLMKAGAPFEVLKLQHYCASLIASYDRNPFALLALRHVKDPQNYLLQHLLSSAVLGLHFARAIGLADDYVAAIALGGLLFDIGRVRLPAALSNKTTKLTEAEFDLFRKHIDFALSSIRNTDGLVKLIYQMIDDHHEKVDGTGYPSGKQDQEISVYGKMAAIIDAYDAMTSEQQHKASMGPVKACQQLMKESDLAFDKDLVRTFVASLGRVPVGACVGLSNGRVGFVLTLNKAQQPDLVRQVYSLRQKTFIPVVDVSVDQDSSRGVDVSIEKEIDPQLYNIKFIDHLL